MSRRRKFVVGRIERLASTCISVNEDTLRTMATMSDKELEEEYAAVVYQSYMYNEERVGRDPGTIFSRAEIRLIKKRGTLI